MADEGETVVGSILGYLRMDDSPWAATIERAKAKARELSTVNPNIAIRTNAELAIAQLRAVKAAESDLAQNSRVLVRATKDVETAQTSAVKAAERLKLAQEALAVLDERGGGTGKQQESALKRVYAAEAAVLAVANRIADAQHRVATATQDVETAQVRVNARLAEAKRLAAEGVDLKIRSNAAQFLADNAKMRADVLSTGVAFERAKDDAERALADLDRAMNASGHSVLKTWNTVRDTLRKLPGAGGAAAAGPSGSLAGGPGLIFYGIAAGALLAGPAIGGATAAMAGFAGMTGTAYAVYKGFQQELKDGTPIGLRLQGALQGIGSEVTHIEEVAANSASDGVLAMLDQLHAAIPEIEPEVANLAAHLGHALNIATPGVISIAKQLGPILNDAGVDAEHLAQGFTNFANSPRFRQFLAYARQELPVVAHDAGDVAKALVDIGVALQPLGDRALTRLDGLVKVVDKLTPAVGALSKVTGGQGGLGGAFTTLEHVVNPGTALLDHYGNTAHKTAQQQATQAQAAIQQSIAQNQANVALSAGYEQAKAFTDANTAATSAIEQRTAADAAATRQMYLESDAGGLLKQQLDALSGKQLDAAQAQNQFEQTLVSGAQTVASAKQAHDKLATSLGLTKNGFTGVAQAQIENRASLLSQVQAAEASAEAFGLMDKSGEATRQRLIQLRKQIIDNARANGMNVAEVTKYVDSVLKIPAHVTTKTDVDTAAAQQRLAVLNNTLGHMVGPTLTVRARVDGALANIRSVVEYAANQTAVIHVVTQTSTGFVGGGRQTVEGHAAGGDIHGPGTGTSDSVPAVNTSTGQPIALSNGEEIQTAASNRRNHAALEAANHGATLAVVKRYAAGGDIVSLSPSASGSGSRGRTSGHTAKETVVPLMVTAGGGQAYGIASYISRQRSAAVRAMRDLSAAVNDAFQLKGLQAKLAAAKAGLANLQTARANLAAAGTDALRAGIDPSQYGDATDLASVYQNRAAVAGQFRSQVRKLAGEHLNNGLLAELAGKGASAGLDALAAASPTQIAQLNKAYAGYITATGTAGTVAANTIYNPGIAADQRAVAQYTAQSARTEQAMLRAMAMLGQLLGRPAKVVANGKEFAHLVIESNEFQGVFDDLARTISYGRR